MALLARRPISKVRSAIPIVVAVGVVVALGIRLVPDASAAVVEAETETVGNIVFERSSDNLLGITNKDVGIRLEDNLDAAPQDATQEQLNALISETRTWVRDKFGWDLSVPEDRTHVIEEVQSLAQALGTIPDEQLKLEENAPIAALRDLADELEGVAECRGRCLPEGPEYIKNRVVSTMAAGTVNKILGMVTEDSPGAAIAVFAMSLYVGVLVDVVLMMASGVPGISSETLRLAVIGGLVGVLLVAKGFAKDAQSMASKSGNQVRDDAKKAAQEVADITPADPEFEKTSDYDMVKDEL